MLESTTSLNHSSFTAFGMNYDVSESFNVASSILQIDPEALQSMIRNQSVRWSEVLGSGIVDSRRSLTVDTNDIKSRCPGPMKEAFEYIGDIGDVWDGFMGGKCRCI